MLDKIKAHSGALLDEIIGNLSPFDCRSLATCSRELYEVTTTEQIWRMKSNNIVGLKGYCDKSLEQLKRTLRITTYYRFYCALQRLKFDIFGFYRMFNTERKYKGVLYSTRIDHDESIVCFPANSRGEEDSEYSSFRLSYDPLCWCLTAQTDQTSVIQVYGVHFNTLMRFYLGSSPPTCENNSCLNFEPLPAVLQLPGTKLSRSLYTVSADIFNSHILTYPGASSIHPNLRNCLGLCTGLYGPHGVEILHLSVIAALDEHGALRMQLQAYKVTGDRNVPTGKVSFLIDLDRSLDTAEEVARDARPVFVLATRLGGTPVLLDLTQLRPRGVQWYQGRGQINRVPGVWAPKWVNCSMLLYTDAPHPVTGAFATVVWEDAESMMVRHGMDIEQLRIH